MRLFRRSAGFVARKIERERKDSAARGLDLARDIVKLAPDRFADLLAALRTGIDDTSDEFSRYQAAEALTRAVYPKFKFSEYGRLFLEDQTFIKFYEKFMDAENWHSLDRKYTLNELLKLVSHLDGDIVECGCHKGVSAHMMCEASRGSVGLVHLFDSFEGLPEPELCDGSYWSKGALAVTETSLHDTLAGYDNYRVYKGWIPERFVEVADRHFRFLHIDVDLYRPTLDSLMFFYSRVQPGGIILLDDHGFKTCPGAKQAADEFFATKPEQLVMLPTGQAFTIKSEDRRGRRGAIIGSDIAEQPERLSWTPALVQRFWDGFSQTRLVEFAFSRQGGRSLLIAIDHLARHEARILDFGAGDGHLVRLMLERGLTVAAHEPSRGRLANLEGALAAHPGFLGVIGSDSTETFDVAIMAEVVEHILDRQLEETLTQLASWLKPSGLLIVTTPNDEDLELGMVYCPVSNQLFHRWQHVRSFNRESLCALLSRFGFDEVVTHHVGFDEAHFVPWDRIWGGPHRQTDVPDYIVKLRRNQAVKIGSQANLLFIGRKRNGVSK